MNGKNVEREGTKSDHFSFPSKKSQFHLNTLAERNLVEIHL